MCISCACARRSRPILRIRPSSARSAVSATASTKALWSRCPARWRSSYGRVRKKSAFLLQRLFLVFLLVFIAFFLVFVAVVVGEECVAVALFAVEERLNVFF